MHHPGQQVECANLPRIDPECPAIVTKRVVRQGAERRVRVSDRLIYVEELAVASDASGISGRVQKEVDEIKRRKTLRNGRFPIEHSEAPTIDDDIPRSKVAVFGDDGHVIERGKDALTF